MSKIKINLIMIDKENTIKKELNAIKKNNSLIYKDEYKTIIEWERDITITRIKDNYKLQLNLIKNEHTISRLTLNNNLLELNTYTKLIEIKDNYLKVIYLIEDNEIKLEVKM